MYSTSTCTSIYTLHTEYYTVMLVSTVLRIFLSYFSSIKYSTNTVAYNVHMTVYKRMYYV